MERGVAGARTLPQPLRAPQAREAQIIHKPWYSKQGLDGTGRACYSRAHAKVAQSVEHSTENAGVGSSILPLGIFWCQKGLHSSSKQLGSRVRLTSFFTATSQCSNRVATQRTTSITELFPLSDLHIWDRYADSLPGQERQAFLRISDSTCSPPLAALLVRHENRYPSSC